MAQSNSLAPMSTYLAFSTQVSDALQSLLETTGVRVKPAVEFVSCGTELHEHFVPRASLENHLRKCHGERHSQPINNAAFYYGREDPRNVEPEGGEVKDEEDSEGLRSLLEAADTESIYEGLERGLIAAIRRTATSAGGFYQQVQAWQRIPRAFDSMQKSELGLVTPSSLRRWLNNQLSRLPGDEPVDEELVDYVAGLLGHPDFCQPDLLVLELHEFLGSSAGNFVLSLWKFLIVEIGLQSVFQTEKDVVDNTIQTNLVSNKHAPVTPISTTDTLQPKISDDNATAERDYKRRRASYRGKIGTKTGPAAFREMIHKHMVGLSLELDRELFHGDGFQEGGIENNRSFKPHECRPKPLNWRGYTDALEPIIVGVPIGRRGDHITASIEGVEAEALGNMMTHGVIRAADGDEVSAQIAIEVGFVVIFIVRIITDNAGSANFDASIGNQKEMVSITESWKSRTPYWNTASCERRGEIQTTPNRLRVCTALFRTGFPFAKWPHAVQAPQTATAVMAQRFSDPSASGNNNNFVSDRSSTRLCKPPGGGSTMGSLIFGDGGDGNQPSYLDERKSRRFNPHRSEGPEHSGSNNDFKTPDAGAAELSYYAKSSTAQELRDRLAVAPGAVSRETLAQQPSALTVIRRGNHSGTSSNYFASGMGDHDGGDDQTRRTRRMFAAPGGNSSFKLG